MPSCVLRYCTNNSNTINKIHGVTFHTFPRPGHEKRESWIKFVQKNRGEEFWLPSDYSRICSKHFKEDDKYITKTGRIFLKKSAVPYDNMSDDQNENDESSPRDDQTNKTASILNMSDNQSGNENISDQDHQTIRTPPTNYRGMYDVMEHDMVDGIKTMSPSITPYRKCTGVDCTT
ncbi:THAP domain-containing protein [Phthorimaea operculella]|nr:THAP domain-containing protein [Phthorimaea operculella]